MERFKRGLNHTGLQGHLLARQDEAIPMGNEYLSIMKRNAPMVREVEMPDVTEIQVFDATKATPSESHVFMDLSKDVERMRTEMANLKGQSGSQTSFTRKPLIC